jgi:putative pyruvate formate lyase activating enzyme
MDIPRDAAQRDDYPCYRVLAASGELKRRIERAYMLLESCTLCPRQCRVNRLKEERGFCRTGLLPVISSFGPHFGEEPPLVGRNGSGTIFVTHCNLACQFCQNYAISQCERGEEVSCEKLAWMMIRLQEQGCHNINLVTPTHIVPQILASLEIAIQDGLCIPLVYNSSGYDSVDTLRILDGIVDIYMPDAKYGSDETAWKLSHALNYVATMKAGIAEMHRQVGDLVIENGIAVRGMIIRHLVLPDNFAGSDIVLPWIAREISPDTYVNIMDQYYPSWNAGHADTGSLPRSLHRRIRPQEYQFAVQTALRSGLHRGFTREIQQVKD